jgi:N-acetylmuramoyl-L-alanine amidase
MKSIYSAIFLSFAIVMSASAQSLQGKKIYINPGHGGYEASQGTYIPGEFANGYRSDGSTSTDRWNATIPFPTVCEEGVWESKHNLWRGLELQRLLTAAGADVKMSRTENNPQDDRILTEIGDEATSWGADMFVSVHTNANGSNYVMTIFRGADPRPNQTDFNINDPDLPASRDMARLAWSYLHDNNLTCWQTLKSPDSPYAVADSAFYSSWNSEGYHLGVLRHLWVPGFLAECSFHDYKPETHRLLSQDYSKIVAYSLYNMICDYFEAPMPTTGIVAGEVKDAKRIFRDPLYLGATVGDHDQYKPINGAKVTLSGNGINEVYYTDDYYNGIFYFPDLAPGEYTLTAEADGYTTLTETIECVAGKTRGPIMMLDDPNYDPTTEKGWPNLFASALSTENGFINFTLNGDADNVRLNVLGDSGEVLRSVDLGAGTLGHNVVQIPEIEGISAAEYSWSLTVSGEAITEPIQISENGDAMLEIANIRGLSIDRNQKSPYFGRIYATSIAANSKKGARLGTGIYILDAAHSDVTSQGNTPYDGGEAWSGNSSPMRPYVAPDGKVYICDWSDGHSGIWVMDPENPAEPFTPVFSGTRNSDGLISVDGTPVAGSTVDICVTGTDENTVLYTADEDYDGGNAKILRYDIGSANMPWNQAPNATYGNCNGKLVNGSQTVNPDGRGGLWIGHNRDTESETYPAALHINGRTGQYDFTTGDASIFKSSTPLGALGVNADGSMIAVAGKTDIRVASVTFDENDVPSLTLLYTIGSTYGNRPFAVDFDAADNLYVAYNDNSGGIGVWALPKERNEYTTVANMPVRLNSGIVDIQDSNSSISCINGIVSAHGNKVSIYNALGIKVAQGSTVDISGLHGIFIARAGTKVLKIMR